MAFVMASKLIRRGVVYISGVRRRKEAMEESYEGGG